VEIIHNVLGWTRDGKNRLPGATDQNPVGGGLRIGKMDESGPDRDGQYHYCLTLWMYALNRLSIVSADLAYNDLAILWILEWRSGLGIGMQELKNGLTVLARIVLRR
jgi:hypothetical protein